jgi:hypothetical protein
MSLSQESGAFETEVLILVQKNSQVYEMNWASLGWGMIAK